MSFSNQIKNEICEVYKMSECCKVCLLYGILSTAKTFNETEIEFLSESNDVAIYFSRLIGKIFKIRVEVDKSILFTHKKEIYQIKISNKNHCKIISDSFNCGKFAEYISQLSLNDDATWAYIKGIFLGGGSISDPQSEYHLEIIFRQKNNAVFAQNMFSSLNLVPKITQRRGLFVVYFKDSSMIEDVLAGINAVKGVLQFMDSKVIKDLRNRLNRRNNCETANMQKTINVAGEQTKAIEYIISKKGIDFLSEDLQRIALFRLNNPEMSLSSMAKELSGEFSKSAIDRRLKKIVEIYKDIIK